MSKDLKIPHYIYILILVVAISLMSLHELECLPSGYYLADNTTMYYLQMFCIIITLGGCWTGLRLFAGKKIQEQISKGQSHLTKWNLIRISIVAIPLFINLEAYYAILYNSSFLYCFLITLISFVFCWPQKSIE